MPEGAFPRDRDLTAIAIAYENPDNAFIADAIFPRVQVGRRRYGWFRYDIAEAFTVPDTRVGQYAAVPSVQLQGTEMEGSVTDQAIQIPLSRDDIDEAPKGVDPKARATARATNLILLDRERRAAALAFDAAQYEADSKTQLAGATQWSHASADPLSTILAALDTCLVRPNVMCFGQAAWTKTSQHASLVKAAGRGGSDGKGKITKAELAELLELDEIIVGKGFLNVVKPGQTPVFARVWGKHALAFYRDRTAGPTGGVTYGWTAQHGTREAGSKDLDIGAKGGVAVRSVESVKEVIVAPRAAYFFQDAVA